MGTWRGSIGGDGGAGTGTFWSAEAVGSRCRALRKHSDPNSKLATGIACDCRQLSKTKNNMKHKTRYKIKQYIFLVNIQIEMFIDIYVTEDVYKRQILSLTEDNNWLTLTFPPG